MVPTPKQYPKEQHDRAVRMLLDRLDDYPSMYTACNAIAPKLGIGAESLRRWTLQAQIDSSQRQGSTSDELTEIKALKGEVRDRGSCQRNPQTGVEYRCEGTRPSPPLICQFIDQMRARGFADRDRSAWSCVSRAARSPQEPIGRGRTRRF